MTTYEDIKQMWKTFNINSETKLDSYLSNYRILFAYNSGKIENENIKYSDTREIFENGRVVEARDIRTIFELQNQKFCYEYLKSKIINKEQLSIELIKKIHKIMTYGTFDNHRFNDYGERPGEFKKRDFVTGPMEIGTSPIEVEYELQVLLDEVNSYNTTDENLLYMAAYAHAKFEYIHPFSDGNGRVGRTILNYQLMIHDHPPLIIYEEDKHEYYEALLQYDKNEDIQLLHDFFKYELIKTWQKTFEHYIKNL